MRELHSHVRRRVPVLAGSKDGTRGEGGRQARDTRWRRGFRLSSFSRPPRRGEDAHALRSGARCRARAPRIYDARNTGGPRRAGRGVLIGRGVERAIREINGSRSTSVLAVSEVWGPSHRGAAAPLRDRGVTRGRANKMTEETAERGEVEEYGARGGGDARNARRPASLRAGVEATTSLRAGEGPTPCRRIGKALVGSASPKAAFPRCGGR